jgi:putative ABC transport system permease protein
MIQLRAITKDYVTGDTIVHALNGLDIDFRDNEFVAVLGPSGCGKTTFMNIVGGLDRATSGHLIVDGIATDEYRDADWDDYRNKRVGFVFQTYNLITHISVLENVELALTLSGISKSERTKRAISVIEEVGLHDQLHKRPNQLSGGQMQRVAIARALVNHPDILLADEPTGALDSVTSTQILDLIKRIAARRLVIMVTHNAELAHHYANRVVTMLDGKIQSDSHPLSDQETIEPVQVEKASPSEETVKGKKSKMSFITALTLSSRNLLTKKRRTIMTTIASSIGIMGIALVLAVSNGTNRYISQLQSDTLASSPLTITETSIDMTQAMQAMTGNEALESFPDAQEVFVKQAVDTSLFLSKNHISDEYISYLTNELDPTWYNDILYKTGMSVPLYTFDEALGQYKQVGTTSSGTILTGGGASPQVLLEAGFVNTQYEVLAGTYPANKNEVAIVVADTNEIPEVTLIAMGYRQVGDENTAYSFEEIRDRDFKLLDNDRLYELVGSSYAAVSPLDIDFAGAETLNVSAILRVKETIQGGVLVEGLAYTPELYDYLQTQNLSSEIISFMNDHDLVNPFTGVAYQDTLSMTALEQWTYRHRALGGNDLPNEISIYPVDYVAKDAIITTLDAYNVGRANDDMVTYTDMSALMGTAISSVVNVVTYVLIGFTAISLIVSCIMIAIITRISVLERTKEIGILRSIGARKKDVIRIFNAETFIIGVLAGALAIITTYLLTIPINLVIDNLISVAAIAQLNVLVALGLVFMNVGLTILSGLLPARAAAKQDPVVALRTE